MKESINFFSGTRTLSNMNYNKIKIQLFGDSVLRGYLTEAGGVRALAYPETLIQDYFNKLYGFNEISVDTRAVDGTHAGMLLNGTDGLNSPWPNSVNSDLVIINHGVNDSAYIAAGLRTQAEYIADLQSLISNSPVKVVLITPTPVNNANPNLAPAMRNIAIETGTTLIDVRAYIDGVAGWYANYAPDGIHLNNAGYNLIYQNNILPGLEPIIESLR